LRAESRTRTRAQGAYADNDEPSLDEILSEPIIRRLMARDGSDEACIRQLAAIVIREFARQASLRDFEPRVREAPPLAVPAVRTLAGGREKSETDQARYDPNPLWKARRHSELHHKAD